MKINHVKGIGVQSISVGLSIVEIVRLEDVRQILKEVEGIECLTDVQRGAVSKTKAFMTHFTHIFMDDRENGDMFEDKHGMDVEKESDLPIQVDN